MVRPLKEDRDAVAVVMVRVSPKTKQILTDLKKRHNFQTIDKVLQYYLSSDVINNKPIFHTAREIYDLTRRQPYDKIIKDAARNITLVKVNKSSLNQSKARPSFTRHSWRQQRRKRW